MNPRVEPPERASADCLVVVVVVVVVGGGGWGGGLSPKVGQ